ncbi:hypothetical protein [Streptomyces sp. NBC_01207]|uniref:hypothetical protein n=1 Tax=Streptomyces sp. NBC_01207 TaxID=2903772 RepID=UPI002E11432F
MHVVESVGGAVRDGVEEAQKTVASFVGVSGPDLQAGQVDDGLEGPDRGRGGEWGGVQVGGGVLVAQLPGEVGQSDVAGD